MGGFFFFYSVTGEESGKEGTYVVDYIIVVNSRQNSSLMRNCISNS